jgi:hypothetical protein
VRADRLQETNVAPDTDTTAAIDDDGSQGDDNASGAQADEDRERGHRDAERAAGYHANMHRAISGAIWGKSSSLDQDIGSEDDGTDSDETTAA